LPDTGKRLPYPLNWDEQSRLLRQLPEHLASMAVFAVNSVPEVDTSVFKITGRRVKNVD
jgi:hypothetical protein